MNDLINLLDLQFRQFFFCKDQQPKFVCTKTINKVLNEKKATTIKQLTHFILDQKRKELIKREKTKSTK